MLRKSGEFDPMSTALQARDWVRTLEDREASACGVPRPMARARVARRLGESPGTLEGLARGRTKRIPAGLFAKVRDAVIDALTKEIARAEHELALARKSGVDVRLPEMAALETGAAAARASGPEDDMSAWAWSELAFYIGAIIAAAALVTLAIRIMFPARATGSDEQYDAEWTP